MTVDDMTIASPCPSTLAEERVESRSTGEPLTIAQMKTRWRVHAGTPAWPTILLMGGVVVGEALVWTAAFRGLLPTEWSVVFATLLAYAAFTVMHEASHGNISGGHKCLARVEEGLGWLSALLLFAPYPVFRMLHLRHHSHTNDPDEDPDYWVASNSFTGVLARCWTILPKQYGAFLFGALGRTTAGRKVRRTSLLGMAVIALLAVALVLAGFGREVLWLWFVPAWIASGFLAFAFDWLPHQPHVVRARFKNTRVLLFPGATVSLLWQNYHLIHHLYPRVPFYRYNKVFEEIRPFLESEGAPIDEWGR